MCGRRGASRFRQAHATRAMEVLPADFGWVVCQVWRAWRVIGDSCAAAGCCAGHGVSAAVCVIGLQLLRAALFRGSIQEKISKKRQILS